MGVVRKEISLAPAIDQSQRSSPSTIRAWQTVEVIPSKTQRFRWFHMIQAPNMIRELSPCWTIPLVASLTLSHQVLKNWSKGWGAREWSPTCLRKIYRNCRVKTQEVSRWLIFSSSWSHNGHCSGLGIPASQDDLPSSSDYEWPTTKRNDI